MRLIDADALLAKFNKKSDIWTAITDVKMANDFAMYCKVADAVEEMPTIGGWISVKDRLPENAEHLGSFCPRYQVMTKYGTTEGWYNPDKGCWYTLVWFLIGRFDEDDIDMERGDIPRLSKKIDVTHWMPMPEPPKEVSGDDA